MTEFLQTTLLPLIEQFKSYAAWIAFFAAFGETLIGLGYFIPGSTLLLFLGVLAGQGYLDIKTLFLFAVAGAYLGDITNYHLGRRYGVTLLKKPRLHLSGRMIDSAHRFLNTHGAKSLFFARFLPGLKESISFLAGSLKMHRGKFLVWDFLGAVGWSLEFIGTGYLFSASLGLAQVWLSRTVTVVALLVFLLILLYMLKRFFVRNAPIAKSIALSLWNAFLNTKQVRAFTLSHPKLTAFLHRRFDRSRFSGLPLTLFTLAFLYVLALFGGIVEDILTKDPIIYADRIFANLVVQWRTPEMTTFFTWVTYLGKWEVVLFFLAAATLILSVYRKFNELISLYLSVVGSVLFVYLGKMAFQRPRPETALYFEPTWSFPSGHALIAVSFYGFLGYLLMTQKGESFRTKVNIFFATVILALLIGFSRIYLGVHYLSDVYGGFLLGTLWVLAAAAMRSWLSERKLFANREPLPHAKAVSLFILALSALFFIFFGIFYSYKPAKHPQTEIEKIRNISQLLNGENERFTRNMFGFKSLPLDIVITAPPDISLCRELKAHGWHKMGEKRYIDSPIFWHYRSPVCSLYKENNGTIYLLKVWAGGTQMGTKRVYTAVTDAVTGFRWKILPIFTANPGDARSFVVQQMKAVFPESRLKEMTFGSPAIRERLFGQPYFSDGKVDIVYIESDKNR